MSVAQVTTVRHRPGPAHLGAPEGFHAMPFAQAMVEHAKRLMELVEGGEDDFDGAMQAAMVL